MTKTWNRLVERLRAVLPPWQNARAPWAIFAALIAFGIGNYIFWSSYVPSVPQGLEAIKRGGTLTVLTRLSPTTFYLGTEGETGFEYLAMEALAKDLDVRAEYRFYDSVPDLIEALRAGKGHIAAPGLLVEDTLKEGLSEGPGYQTVNDIVVCRRDRSLPKSVKDLAGLKIWVRSGTSAAERLLTQQTELTEAAAKAQTEAAAKAEGVKAKAIAKGKELKETKPTESTPAFNISDVDQPIEVLFAAVASENLDCTAANSIEFKINNPFFPELIGAFSLGGDQQLKWLIAPGSEDFADYVRTWLAAQKRSGALDNISRRFFGFLPPFDYVDVQAFNRAIETTLLSYEKTMRDAARNTGLPWQLIAAVAYQESHWNPLAKSPTGVRGIMMLTADTAEHLGVTDRLDPVQSIHAGARYIADLRAKMPEDVAEPDRLWLALAAYNMGYAHLLDARAVAESMGLNKNRWTDLRRAMSVMGDPAYAGKLRSGRAKSGQALRFVQQVRAYQHILDAPH
ncbi:MAG: transglycosylase SLT domain-containing protein [Parvibaculum sp.]|nr:transglycosylase SLT domain-containing protein [Parvibaculum sp.]